MIKKNKKKPIVKSTFFTLFKGYIIRKGKNTIASKIINRSFLHAFLKTRNPSSIVLNKYVKEVGTILDIRDVSFRGDIIRVPFALTKDKRNKQIFRSLLASVRTSKIVDKINSKISTDFINAILGRDTGVHAYNLDNAREAYTKRYVWTNNWKI